MRSGEANPEKNHLYMEFRKIFLSSILDDEFRIVVVETPKVEVDIPRDKLLSFIKLAEELGWEKSKLKRYVNAALRLRKLEREAGKSYISLLRDYNKLSSEEVKLRYTIEQLMEKRKRIEDDLNLYLEQYKLTLELVRKIAKLADALRERGLSLDDLEKAMNVIESFKNMNYNPQEILAALQEQRDLKSQINNLKNELENVKREIEQLHREKQKILGEIEEVHGISGELEELKEFKSRLEEEVQETERRVNETKAKLEEVNAELEQRLGQKTTLEELEELIRQLRSDVERLKFEKERLNEELSELLGVRGEIEEIRKRIEEERKKLEELEKDVSSRETYLEILEGELSAAYTMLKLFTDPQGVEAEDLETLVDQLQKILKIKRGELSALKPLEPHLVNRVRESIISLILPYVRNEFVPKKVFDQLEKEVKRLSEKKAALEEELSSLRRALEARKEEAPKPTVKESYIEAFTADGKPVELKNLDKGRRVRIICPSCKNSAITNIPPKDELEELASNNCKLVFTCGKCGKSFDIPIEILLKKWRAE